MSVSKKNDFVSNPNLPKWPFLQKMGQFGNIPARKCFVAKNVILEMFRKFKIAHLKVGFRMGWGHQDQQ